MLSRMSSRARWAVALRGWPASPRVPAPGQLLDAWTRRPSGSAGTPRSRAGTRRGSAGRCRWSCRTAGRCAASGTCSLMKASVWRAGLLERDGGRRDLRRAGRCVVCMLDARPSSIAASGLGRRWTTRSGPSATISSSSSVTSVAISTMTWRAGSRPVISRSIQTSTGADLGRRRAAPVDRRYGRRPCSTSRSSASTPTCRCPPTPRRATPAPTSWPARRVTLAPGGGRALVPTGIALAIPDGLRRVRAAPQRAGAAPRRHLPQHARASSTPATATSSGCCWSTSTRPSRTRCSAATASPSWWSSAVEHAAFVAVDELPDSERGLGGFGSTGV